MSNIIYCVAASGITNGSLNLNNTGNEPDRESMLALQLIKERGWTYTGPTPVYYEPVTTSGLVGYYVYQYFSCMY